MNEFSTQWLSLRRKADRRARNKVIMKKFCNWLVEHAPKDGPLKLIDMAAGTGPFLHDLAVHIGPNREQAWLLVDNNPALLKVAEETPPPFPQTQKRTDICELTHTNALDILEGQHGVVTSAFLDLVSAYWLDSLIAKLQQLKLPFLAGLSYNGVLLSQPHHPADRLIQRAFNQHQATDKGFGSALGPLGGFHAHERLLKAGYTCFKGRSDWVCTPEDKTLQLELIKGWAQAAREIGVSDMVVDDWLEYRLRAVGMGTSQLQVGHVDLVGLPPG
ncbi:hypothetical protein PsAD2_02011 [Pseudovibrio axinellae]|uniref:Methyltransferase domain protein n=1 Tax=Pseudovibrio axinellae TaxID=989403 RepID=A0A165YV23_9HYPH|nr:glycosyl transferase family 1 [Pseudovibrio axinellae]KZL19260.1 hypothetical protein PsAD2_02011 [Pseudovibrio axinellae]SEQ43822.1 hypothetical protein SAMN05421798_102696 [Pseudovibrio axinellae]